MEALEKIETIKLALSDIEKYSAIIILNIEVVGSIYSSASYF